MEFGSIWAIWLFSPKIFCHLLIVYICMYGVCRYVWCMYVGMCGTTSWNTAEAQKIIMLMGMNALYLYAHTFWKSGKHSWTVVWTLEAFVHGRRVQLLENRYNGYWEHTHQTSKVTLLICPWHHDVKHWFLCNQLSCGHRYTSKHYSRGGETHYQSVYLADFGIPS